MGKNAERAKQLLRSELGLQAKIEVIEEKLKERNLKIRQSPGFCTRQIYLDFLDRLLASGETGDPEVLIFAANKFEIREEL